MLNVIARLAAIASLLAPAWASAEPITLKLSFFTSDRSTAYQAVVKPFVEAVNREGGDRLRIQVYPSGTLGKIQKDLPQLVLQGGADIAFIVPGQNPELFTDNTVIELPGLYRNAHEASLVYTRLIHANLLAGYEGFFPIVTVATDPEPIHSRKNIASLADIRGQKIRANNPTGAVALAKLGALPIVLAFNETAPAISAGAIDGATIPTAQLFDVGVGRLVSNHYMLGTSSAPLTLLMNRHTFDGLPDDAKNIIRKYSGEWTAPRFATVMARASEKIIEEIKSDGRRHVVIPSPSDQDTADKLFKSVVDDWSAVSVHNRALLKSARDEIAKIRAEQRNSQ
jgi:TRAP-type C4-dicarboxylate transport system substrate-binding protein